MTTLQLANLLPLKYTNMDQSPPQEKLVVLGQHDSLFKSETSFILAQIMLPRYSTNSTDVKRNPLKVNGRVVVPL